MRYAIISDIHGNLQALTAVLLEIRKLNVERLLCTGDIIGYGANPKECLDTLRKLRTIMVAGNHDWAVSGRLDAAHFTDDGKAAVLWTRTQISLEDITFLNGLQSGLQNKDCLLVHGSLVSPENFIYMHGINQAIEAFPLLDRPVCFTGHTHVPRIFVEHKGQVFQNDQPEIEIKPDCKCFVNVGSVGQPRDGNPMASFCIYDADTRMIELKRVPYDIAGAQKSIMEAGLPSMLAQRLSTGD